MPEPPNHDVTQVLDAIERGRATAAELLPIVYDELRKLAAVQLAREKPGQTLNATALVHEAYVRLVGARSASKGNLESLACAAGSTEFANRRHFFAAAAEAMRRILVESARRKNSQKRGGQMDRVAVEPDELAHSIERDPGEALALHELLDRLAVKAPREAELVKLRYFLGCTIPEAAALLGIAPATAEEDWTYAKAWLKREWQRDDSKT